MAENVKNPVLLGRPLSSLSGANPKNLSLFSQQRPDSASARAKLGAGEAHTGNWPDLGPVVESSHDAHLMTIAPTGAGKGRDVIIPNLLSYEGSVVVLDPKGENYDVTHKFRGEKLGQEIVVLDPFGKTTASDDERGQLNPFDVFNAMGPRGTAAAFEEAGDFGRLLSDILMGGLPSLSDPFWDDMAQLLIAAVTSDMMTSKKGKPCSLEELRRLVFSSDLRYQMAVTLDERESELDPGTAQEYKMLLGIDADKTFSGILATAAQQLSPFGTRASIEATRSTSFDLAALTNPAARISIYIVIPPHKLRTHKRLVRAWVGSLLYFVMNNHNPKARLLFLIDEAAQLGKFSLLEEAITLLRGYGMRTWTFWQDLAQLISIYEKGAETMINNSGVLQIFGTTNFGAAKAISERIGCSVEDLMQLSNEEQILAFNNEWPAKVERISYLTDPVLTLRKERNPHHPD